MKKIFLVLGLLIGGFSVSAQTEFSHAAGVSYILGNYKYTASQAQILAAGVDESGTYNMGYPVLTYAPRLDKVLSPEMSFGVGAYPSAGINISSNSREGSSGGYFCFDLPVAAQLNFGHASTARSRSGFGGYFGAGYSIGYYSGIGMSHGPTAQLGLRFKVSDKSVTVRLLATKPLNINTNESLMYFGGGFLYNLTYQGYKIIK